MKRSKKKFYLIVGLCGMLLSALITYRYADSGMENKRNEALYIGEVYGERLESMLNLLFHKTDIFETIIMNQSGEIPEKTFDDLSRTMIEENRGIRAIQCLPGGTVEYCYPIKGNEKAIGGNIFLNEKRRADAILAKETHEITLSGPYPLTQGGYGIVARNPIYLTDEDGKESFWGFSVIVLDIPEALDMLLLQEIERNDFQYRLTTVVDGKRIEISSSADYQERLSYVEELKVPNHTWQMELSPGKSWYDIPGSIGVFVISVGITILLSVLVYILEKHNQNLKEWAERDSLTGLINRRKLMDYIELRCNNTKVPFALLYCDVNDFKSINDTYGHDCGDVILKEAAKRMVNALWKEDIVARLGGDEFVIIIERCREMEEYSKCIEKLRSEIEKPLQVLENELSFSISVGYAFFPGETQNVQELIQLADKRMYEEKKKRKQLILQ